MSQQFHHLCYIILLLFNSYITSMQSSTLHYTRLYNLILFHIVHLSLVFIICITAIPPPMLYYTITILGTFVITLLLISCLFFSSSLLVVFSSLLLLYLHVFFPPGVWRRDRRASARSWLGGVGTLSGDGMSIWNLVP